MAKQVTQFDLLVSCPSDVQEELEIIKETVDNFNRMYGTINNAFIVPRHWSTDSYPESGGHPQKLLNKQFVLDCDAAIAVFWTRFGTPTDEYGSGTEEEIEELIKSGKQVFLYFSDCPVKPSSINDDQYQKVLKFREKYENKGIYWTYSDLNNFRRDLLNHLSLYFVKLLTGNGISNNTTKSKLLVKGVTNGEVTDNAVIFRRNTLNSEFINKKRESISEIYKQVKNIVIPQKIIESRNDTSTDKALLSDEIASLMSSVALSLQEQMKNIGSIFSSSKMVISDNYKNTIIQYANKNNISLNEEEFFYIGDLIKQQQPIGGGPYGIGPSYNYNGTDEEKNKYNFIKELYFAIDEFNQYYEYFTEIDNKFYLQLVLSNLGTNFDEDIDIKIFITKGKLCFKDQLPFPGDDILKTITLSFDKLFTTKKTVYIDEYSGYPILPAIPVSTSFGISSLSYEDKVKNYKENYIRTQNKIFFYDYFQDNSYDILCYNQKYIKQNTSTFFPSILVFNFIPDKIVYEISSKHCSEIIKGELSILENL